MPNHILAQDMHFVITVDTKVSRILCELFKEMLDKGRWNITEEEAMSMVLRHVRIRIRYI